ncbi:MAG: V-type ATPase 116kDa subunit family protein [Gammaproteobacteria bacterium]|jgi:V/A-type H+-transporting ATPase subunit I
MLRPRATRWLEMLVAREDLTAAVGVLAGTGRVELETRGDEQGPLYLPRLRAYLDEYHRLERCYRPYWPKTEFRAAIRSASPKQVLETGLARLRAWEQAAARQVRALEACSAREHDLRLVHTLVAQLPDPLPDLALLERAGPALAVRLFAFPPGSAVERLPDVSLYRRVEADDCNFVLVVGEAGEVAALEAAVAETRGRAVALPAGLRGDRAAVLQQIAQRLGETQARIARLRQELQALTPRYHLARVLAEIRLLEWFTDNISGSPGTANFAWVTGWTDDFDGRRIRAALAHAGIAALVRVTHPPAGATPPMVLHNPAWARPFELFTRMLGTPGSDEADPSPVVAVLVPLLFGYMFGDVGQGLVLAIAGLWLRRRWPVFRVLVINGFAAMLFGLLFGSVFGREDLIAPLWIHPTAHPGPVLLVPLAAGVVILSIGLFLQALESFWGGQRKRWWLSDAPLGVLYLSLLGLPFFAAARLPVVIALLWYFAGSLLEARGTAWRGLMAAAARLLETLLQLLMNTLSFVRVGAFALAHAGLSLAFNTLAAATDYAIVGILVLLLGNLVVIMLEGLVVTVQATRLILFEFFIRFLRGSGRVFRPLAAPRFEL